VAEADVELASEREETGAWSYEARITHDDGRARTIPIRLSWADYNHWSISGADEPSRIAERALRCLLRHAPPSILERARIDLSLVRRFCAAADEEIMGG